MTPGREQIEARAYEIWEREGRPAGREGEHWEQALRELGGGGASSERQEQAGNFSGQSGGQMTGANFDERIEESTSVLGSGDEIPSSGKKPRRSKPRKE